MPKKSSKPVENAGTQRKAKDITMDQIQTDQITEVT